MSYPPSSPTRRRQPSTPSADSDGFSPASYETSRHYGTSVDSYQAVAGDSPGSPSTPSPRQGTRARQGPENGPSGLSYLAGHGRQSSRSGAMSPFESDPMMGSPGSPRMGMGAAPRTPPKDNWNDPYGRSGRDSPYPSPSVFSSNAPSDYANSELRLQPAFVEKKRGSPERDSYDDEKIAALAGGSRLRKSRHAGRDSCWGGLSSRARKLVIAAIAVALLVVAGAVGATLSLMHKGTSNLSTGPDPVVGQSSTSDSNPSVPASQVTLALPVRTSATPTSTAAPLPTNESKNLATGGDGSTVFLSNGTSFVYTNAFGGTWSAIPFNDTAQAQSDVPPLNEPWDYQVNHIHGVNLGGWLVLEPFIAPSLFEPFSGQPGVIDEWTLSVALGANLRTVVEGHYSTFITEQDFAEIAGAGLNWVRLPIPFWIIETLPGEPFLANVGWKYFLLALSWARKYGLRVNLDFHAAPGSQNGYNHSSKQGSINFMQGVMGVANMQRTLNYIRTLAEFISQDQYKNVVQIFSVLNEPDDVSIGLANLRSFYLETYNIVRNISGVGQGNGPLLAFGDRVGGDKWTGFLDGADRIAMDTHPYLVFTDPHDIPLVVSATEVCNNAPMYNATRTNFGIYIAGEWSLAGQSLLLWSYDVLTGRSERLWKWVNNIGNGQRFDGTFIMLGKTVPQYAAVGSCDVWNDYDSYTPEIKAGFMAIAAANVDTYTDSFFWTWKTGYSTTLGKIASPQWNYQLALKNGYMHKNPRAAVGTGCAAVFAARGDSPEVLLPTRPLRPAQTGGAGAGTIAPAQLALYSTWPPVSIGLPQTPYSILPRYAPTGMIITAPPAPTPTIFPIGYGSMKVNVGNGWKDPADTKLMYTPILGCSYLPAWAGAGAPLPPACPAAATAAP